MYERNFFVFPYAARAFFLRKFLFLICVCILTRQITKRLILKEEFTGDFIDKEKD